MIPGELHESRPRVQTQMQPVQILQGNEVHPVSYFGGVRVSNSKLLDFFSIILDAAEGGEISPVDGPESSVLGSLDNIFRSVKDFDQVPFSICKARGVKLIHFNVRSKM